MPITPFAIIPTTEADWTRENVTNLKNAGFAAFASNLMELWFNSIDYANSTIPAKAPPRDPTRLYQPFNMRPSAVPQGTPLTFAVENGRPVAQNLTPDTTGGNPDPSPENFKQPGTGLPGLTTEVLGGGSFALFMAEYGGWFKNGIAKFVWGSVDGIYNLNFSTALPLRPLPVAYNVPGIGSYPYTWPRDVIPYITDDAKIGVVKVEDVKKLGKFGQVQPAAPAQITYLNDEATIGNAVSALYAAGMRGAALGGPIAQIARATK